MGNVQLHAGVFGLLIVKAINVVYSVHQSLKTLNEREYFLFDLCIGHYC